MTILQLTSAIIIGFSLAGMLFSLLNAVARRRFDYMAIFAALSLFTALFAWASLARRGCTDVPLAINLTRCMDIVSFAIFTTLPFLYRNLCNQKPGKPELIISTVYLAATILALVLPHGFSWTRITAMVPIDLGRLGTVYRPEGTVSALTLLIHGTDIFVMGYCANIAWRLLRPMHGGYIFIAVMPFVMIMTVVYVMGNQNGWWHLPAMNEVVGAALYLAIGYVVYNKEKSNYEERQNMVTRLNVQASELHATNVQLQATNQQMFAANIQLTAEIDARSKTESALRLAENRYRVLFNNSFALVGLLDTSGMLLEVNQTALSLIGASEASVKGKVFWECPWWSFDPKEVENCKESVLKAARGVFVRSEAVHCTPTGEKRIIDFSITPVFDEAGKVVFLIPEGRDITEIKKTQKELSVRQQQIIQADKMASLGLMVSGIAHEINNPNNLIMLNADIAGKIWNDLRPIVEQTLPDNDRYVLAGIPAPRAVTNVTTMLSGISAGSRRIASLVASLKDFARLDGAGTLRQVDIGATIEAARLILHHHVQKSTNHFTITIEPDLPAVFGNSQKIEQILINLIVNACQALPSPNRKVEIRCRPDTTTHEVIIDVEDEGCGIPEEIHDKIMDPFFTTKADTGGTGLGLSVTYGLVKDMNATISFTSRVGEGTCFSVRFKVFDNTGSPAKDRTIL